MAAPQQRSWLTRLYTREPDPHRPLDHDYVQLRWVRLHRPGPWRSGAIVATVLTFALCTVTLVAALLTVPGTVVTRVVSLAVGALLVAGAGLLVSRVLTNGVYVTDSAVRVLGLAASSVVPWREVRDVQRVPERVPLLGLGFLRVEGERVHLVLADGRDLPTPLTSWSSDFAGRYEAYDIAALRLERWWQAGRA